MTLNSQARQHERRVVRAAINAICLHWELTVTEVRFPEDEVPRPDRPLDAMVITNVEAIALEHTLHQSFPEQVSQSFWFRPVKALCDELDGELPGPGRYELSVRAEDLQGQGNVDFDPLREWIRTTAPKLTAGRSLHGATNVASAGPPEVPFPVSLLRTEQWEGVPEGALSLRWPIDFDQLPDARVEQMVSTLNRKLPKLEEHRPPGGRTVLVLENQDIQLVNPDIVTESIRQALSLTTLTVPDAIVMVNVIGGSAGLSWLKDGWSWHPHLTGMYWIPIELEF